MKKSLIALAVLGSFAGAASAANTVTLWGKVDTAYTSGSEKTTFGGNVGGVQLQQASTKSKTGVKMSDADESRIGIKVSEDLGNGLSAFVRLEGAMTSDVGSSVGFGRETVIGLKGNFGSVYFGRSTAPMDAVTIGAGNRAGDMGGTIADNGRWSNTAFYLYENNGLELRAAVSTKGGQFGNNTVSTTGVTSGENAKYQKSAVGLSAKYSGKINDRMGYSVAAAYEANGGKKDADVLFAPMAKLTGVPTPAAYVKNNWLVNGTFTYNPVTFGLSYSQHKYYTIATESMKGYKYRAFLSADVTSNDNVYVQYTGEKDTLKVLSATAMTEKTSTWGLGYSHSLSKRTAVFADVGRSTVKDKLYLGGGDYVTAKTRTTSYNIGMRHSF